MNKTQAQTSSTRVNSELFKLTPSSLIELYEIDFTDLVFYPNRAPFNGGTKFRFHNNLKSTAQNIVWRGELYYATPIIAEGFEMTSKGTAPTPKLSISVPDESIDILMNFKRQFGYLNNDLTGAKVTRFRTFAKYLDATNFTGQTLPDNFTPDPYAELSRDIYYINSKTLEDKNNLSFDLTSFFDLNGITLPRRTVFAHRCMFSYRGEGCLYEYDHPSNLSLQRRNSSIHGTATMPSLAPPVATSNNELIFGQVLSNNEAYIDRGEFNPNSLYEKGHGVYIQKHGLNYYFVAKKEVPIGTIPPNAEYWVADECALDIYACELRWATINNNLLPFGGFPGVDRVA